MWMRFPLGTEAVSIFQQEFKPEVTDKDGRGYFRVPNHFAPTLIDIGGFDCLSPPEGTDIEDLPQPDPERDGAIERLTKQVEALREENGAIQAELDRSRTELAQAKADVARLSGKKPT
jgi:hypothetical protein